MLFAESLRKAILVLLEKLSKIKKLFQAIKDLVRQEINVIIAKRNLLFGLQTKY